MNIFKFTKCKSSHSSPHLIGFLGLTGFSIKCTKSSAHSSPIGLTGFSIKRSQFTGMPRACQQLRSRHFEKNVSSYARSQQNDNSQIGAFYPANWLAFETIMRVIVRVIVGQFDHAAARCAAATMQLGSEQ